MRKTSQLAFLLTILTAYSAGAEVSGLILFDRGNLGQNFVRATEIEKIEKGPVSVLVFSSSGKDVILNKEVIEVLSFPDLTRDRTGEIDFVEISKFIENLELKAEKYPLTRPVISKVQGRLESFLQGYKSGLVYVGGDWKTLDSISAEMAAVASARTIIKLKDGTTRVVRKISSVSDDGIVVMSESGASKIAFDNLDAEFAKSLGYDLASKVTKPVTPQSRNIDANQSNGFKNRLGEIIQFFDYVDPSSDLHEGSLGWKPESLGDVAKCVVIIKGDKGSGTGFLCNEGGRSYVYTNAHVIAGNRFLQIYNRDGEVIEDIAGFEVAEAPFGGTSEFSSGDMVRVCLANPRKEALQFSGQREELSEGGEVAAIGNSQGANVIVTLDGTITGVGPDVLEISSEIVQGNSGGPVVSAETYKVLGVATFLKKGAENVWSKDTRFDAVRRFALRTDKSIEWKDLPISTFLRECYLVDTLETDIRILGLLNVLDFKVEGISIDKNLSVEGEYLVGDIIDENRNHPLVKSLLDLDSVLRSEDTQVDYVFHHYVKYLSEGGRAMAQNRKNVEAVELSWYNRNVLERLEILSLHDEKMKRFSDLVAALRQHL
jgi:S1-C subfamily serine protease